MQLKQYFPRVWSIALKLQGKSAEHREFMDECRTYRNDHSNFTLYSLVYIESLIHQLQIQGKLKKSKKTLPNGWSYQGDVDDEGLACGHGIARAHDYLPNYTGTFWND